MGSIGFDTEDESQPSTTECKKYKLQEKLLNDCGAVNFALVPRKQRSATKKRGCKSIVSPLLIPKKRRHVSNGVEDGAKKSRLNMKQGRVITKDEKEVAETLHALANMFFDIANTNKPVLDSEPLEIKSSNVVEAGSSITAAKDLETLTLQEESRKTNTRETLEASCDS
ncbi:hypothetical protein CDL12_18481 [Handroanthus impetiginosus]|uniref:Uncharacterized protein n=1 Tax=Handroanthus impetiginosus TaxID=429701 RepID=A0A2G9GUH0_9LAMI|nr:hypothetical protein CDL12_18481 [Handroanthus impetiginosus]